MDLKIDRRSLLKAGTALAATQAIPAWAQAKPVLRMTSVFSDKDIRADMYRMIQKDMESDFTIETHFMGTLFKQGTELVALQRNNLEIANVSPQDISKQIPAWSVVTAAYVFRDAHHVLAFFKSDIGAQMIKQAEDQLNIKVLGPTFFGTRQVGLKPKKRIQTPADMAGIKLRMPAGDAWQLLGRSVGANPTPLAFAETYLALQTGAVDGQDNPLPNVKAVKFYEVMSQIVLTGHLVAFDVLCMSRKTWDSMNAATQAKFQAAADKALAWSVGEHLKQEGVLADEFRKYGLDIYKPDVDAFRVYANKVYLASDDAKAWAPGILDKIHAVK